MPASDLANRTQLVGSYLKENRVSRGITLEEAARVTRIGKNYLLALEEDNFDLLPSSAYAKGFLRAYASYLGLSSDEVLARLSESTTAAPDQTSVNGNEAAGPVRRTNHISGRLLVPFALLFLVAVTAIFYNDRVESPVHPVPVAATPVEKVAVPVQSELSSVRGNRSAVDVAVVGKKIETGQPQVEPQPKGVVLKLKVNQDGWLNITIDDSISQQYELKAGDLIEWKGDRSFALDISNPEGIEGEFNGSPLKPIGEGGRAAHVVLRIGSTFP